ncbi:MAG: hypothetical protein J0G98_19600 [Terrimonas ferruginea]|uniref:hypothetical protein n=1 Tax=Terrimonas ferruginea TaxID=249 RepID=UPI001AC99EB6|nr:hypothetical protein [Terrimonas ferruginea]MBN8785274.1 hypothetical protein [Terrimonas ferruginea]
MKIRFNKLLEAYLIDFDLDIEEELNRRSDELSADLPVSLKELLASPIRVNDGVFVLSGLTGELEMSEGEIDDKTGVECDVNKINLIDYGERRDAEYLLTQGIRLSILLSRKLNAEYPVIPFRVIFSFGISKYIDSVVRFHAKRAGETWLSENFQNEIAIQGILALEIGAKDK